MSAAFSLRKKSPTNMPKHGDSFFRQYHFSHWHHVRCFQHHFLCLECVATTLLLPRKSFGANTGSQLNLFSTEKLKLLQPLYLYAVIVYEDIKHSVKHFSNGYGSHRLCKQIESHKWTECENVQCKHTDSVTHTYRNVHEKCHHFLCHAFNRENSKKPKELSRAATWNVAC